MSGTHNTLEQINQAVTIQDIVVAECCPNKAGEFSKGSADIATQKTRLYKHIKRLAKGAAIKHREMNFDNDVMMPNKENSVTRLVTNEFAFYTRKPFSIAEFNELLQSIVNLAKQLPENLHLVLSSFAVRTLDNTIMNVVAQIECGVESKLSLIVKNNPSFIDPAYSENIDGNKVTLPNVDIKKNNIENLYITIDGKKVPFSFNCVKECKTVGGAKFHSCIDICLDYSTGVAKKYLNKALNKADYLFPNKLLSTQCSHIVTSNCISLFYPNYAIGKITHADPCSRIKCKEGADLLQKHLVFNNFGIPLRVFVTSPTVCSRLPAHEHALVEAHNNKVLNPNASVYKAPLLTIWPSFLKQSVSSIAAQVLEKTVRSFFKFSACGW